MPKGATIVIDEELLRRGKRVLGCGTTRATVEEALGRAADQAKSEEADRAARQRRYLERFARHVESAVLASEEMWR